MKSLRLFTMVIIAGVALLAGCSLPQTPQAAVHADTPLAWIDAPLDGSQYPLGAVEIVAHASAPDEVKSIQLQVDQQVVTEKPPDEVSDGLALANFVWQPDGPGVYLLSVAAKGADGSLSPFATAVISVGDTLPDDTQTPDSNLPAPTPTETAAPIVPQENAACTDQAGFVGETIPDDTEFKPGAAFTKSWTLVNNGSCTWDAGYSLVFVDGSRMGGASPIALPRQVPPGDRIGLSVDLQAPENTGTYQGNWMLSDPDGRMFGLGADGQTAFWVRIKVVSQIIIIPPVIIDTQAPTISVDYSPRGSGAPNADQAITFTATASDNIGVTLIEIYFSPANARVPTLIGSCTDTARCVITAGPFDDKTYALFAKAYDAAGNQASTPEQNVIVFAVVK